MRQVLNQPDFPIWLDWQQPPYRFTAPFAGEAFLLLLVISDATITNDQRNSLSRQIVDSGCWWAAVKGHECSIWDDALDWAQLDEVGDPRCAHVLTTWHEHEDIQSVLTFLMQAATERTPTRILITVLGQDPAPVEDVLAALEHATSDLQLQVMRQLREILEQVKQKPS